MLSHEDLLLALPTLSLRDLSLHYLEHEGARVRGGELAENSLITRRNGLRCLGPLGDIPATGLTAGKIDRWLRELAAAPGGKQAGGRGRARYALVALRVFLSWCVRNDIYPTNYAREVRFSYRPRQTFAVPDDHMVEVVRVLVERREARRKAVPDLQLARVLAVSSAAILVAATGCRPGEARYVLAEDWLPRQRQLQLRVSKNHRRVLAVPAPLAQVLNEQADLVGGRGFLFPSPHHRKRVKPLSPPTVWREVATVGEIVGVKLFPRKLRHAIARSARRRGRSVQQIAELLGVTTRVVRDHYLYGEETPDGRLLVEEYAAEIFKGVRHG